MPLFQYKAVSPAGEVQEGVLDAVSHDGVVAHLKSIGLIPIRAVAVGVNAGAGAGGGTAASINASSLGSSVSSASSAPSRAWWQIGSLGANVSASDLAILTRELATLLRAGLPLDRAMEILINLAERDGVRALLQNIRNEVRGGASLSKALDQHREVFSRFYVNMVKAGEAGGALGNVLMRLADHLERSKETRDSVVSSMIYPVILMSVAVLSVGLLLVFVVPQFKQIFDQSGKALPPVTEAVVATGIFLRHNWMIVIATSLLIVWLLWRSWQNPSSRPRWDARLLRWPVAGHLVARLEMARFARSLATLLQNGVPLLAALSILKDTLGNAVFRGAVEVVSRELKEGRGMAKPMLETNVFPKLAVQMIAVGEETGRLDEMLLQVAEVYDREVASSIKRALALLQPLMIVFLAVTIGVLIFAIASPMFDMMDLPL
jgi:general secretion pathway protein F